MKTLAISRTSFLLSVIAAFIIFFALSATGWNGFKLLTIYGFLFLILAPGFLTMQAIKFRGVPFWGYLGMTIGFSIFELMFMALVGNTFLPLMGITRPLDKPSLLLDIYFLIGVLLGIVWVRAEPIRIKIKRFIIFENARDLWLALIPLVFVIINIFGAIRLNNGASDPLTILTLIGIAIYAVVLTYYADTMEPDVMPLALFFMALSLLFMTSLRGWFTTGHDIQLESRVFELTKANGIWSIAALKNVYNACLSITILPTLFSNLLNIFDPYVYKVLFQIVFATLPGILYLTVRRYTSAVVSFLSTFYFIAFPIFFTDMPFLNRQEIAFVFFALMLYVIFNDAVSLKSRRILFLILGIGMVLSHYSTTYTVVAILIFLVAMRPLMRWLGIKIKNRGSLPRSAIAEFDKKIPAKRPLITVWMVVILAATSFIWSSILANTGSNNLYSVITQTVAAIGQNTKQDARAADVSYSLFSWNTVNTAQLLQNYQETVIPVLRTGGLSAEYYPSYTYEQYPITVAPSDAIPLTTIGAWISSLKINIVSLTYIFKQIYAKILQLLILIGFIFVIFRKKFVRKKFSTEFILMSVGSIIFVALQVVLPVLSTEYGVLRAFQQSLMFLGIFIVIGSLAIAASLESRKQIMVATILAIAFFLSNNGILTQVFGGSDPQLYLNNTGTYYDLYYTHDTEVSAIEWLAGVTKMSDGAQLPIQADAYSTNKMGAVAGLNALSTIYPSLIKKDTYVFLGFVNVHQSESTVFYNGTLITYIYPIEFLDQNKNLVYNNGDVYIYR